MSPQEERLQRLREALSQFERRLAQVEGHAERCAGRVPDLETSTQAGVERTALLSGLLDTLDNARGDFDAEPAPEGYGHAETAANL